MGHPQLLSSVPVPVLHHPLNKNFLLTSDLNFPSFSSKPFTLLLSLPDHVDIHSPSYLYAPLGYWKATMRSPWSLLFSKLNKPNYLHLSSQERCCSSLSILMDLLWICSNSSASLLCWRSQAWMQTCKWDLTRAEQREMITSLSLLATPLLVQPRILLAFWVHTAGSHPAFCPPTLEFASSCGWHTLTRSRTVVWKDCATDGHACKPRDRTDGECK